MTSKPQPNPRDEQAPHSGKVANDANKVGQQPPTQLNQGRRTPESRNDRGSTQGGANQSQSGRGAANIGPGGRGNP